MTCMQSSSFRQAYKFTRLFNRLPSTKERLKKMDPEVLAEEEKRCRRGANEAFREFLKHLDTSPPMITKTLFSCDTCEVDLSKQDCTELGITEEQGKTMKRLKAIVIDGTASGVLTKLPEFDGETAEVQPAKGGLGASHLLHNTKHEKLLTKLPDIARECLRKSKRKQRKQDTTRNPPNTPLNSGYLSFWLSNPGEHIRNGVEKPSRLMTEIETQLIQLYITGNACFCPPHSEAQSRREHTTNCEEVKESFLKVKGSREAGAVLKQLFSVTQSRGCTVSSLPSVRAGTGGTIQQPNGHEHTEGDEVEESEEEDPALHGAQLADFEVVDEVEGTQTNDEDVEASEALRGVMNATPGTWATLLLPNVTNSAKFAESVIDIVRFLLFEHIALPYVGRIPMQPQPQSAAVTSTTDPPTMLSFTSLAMNLHTNFIETVEAYCSCLHFQESGRAAAVPRECECVLKFKKAAVMINEANPLLGSFCQELLKLRRPLHITQRSVVTSMGDLVKRHMQLAKSFFIRLEKNLSNQARDYWAEHGFTQDSRIHSRSAASSRERGAMHDPTDELDTEHEGATEQTPDSQQEEGTPGQREDEGTGQWKYGSTEFTESGVPPTGALRDCPEGGNEDTGLPVSQENAEPPGNTSSGETQSNADDHDAELNMQKLAERELNESELTGMCFHGRVNCRPIIVFRTKDKQSCRNNYKVSKSHTPGLLTVQCSCDTPKLIGFVIMTEAESTALALSAVLSHFGIPPRTTFYHNACNMFTSTLLRVPWLLRRTKLAVDRFHYKTHKCSAYFNPDSYRQLELQGTEAAESINAGIKSTLNTIRYLKGENFLWFLCTRFSLLNIISCFKQKYQRTDIEDEDMTEFFNEIFTCKCLSCKEWEGQEAKEEVAPDSEDDQ